MDYRIYSLSVVEKIKAVVIFAAVAVLISYLFYDSFIPALIAAPGFLVYVKSVKNSCCKKRTETLKNEFCEMISSLSDSLSAGLSVDNAFIECRKDMIRLYGEDSIIVSELNDIVKRQGVNSSTESALKDFAKRAGIEDISNFSVIFSEVLKSGGNLKDIIKKTISMMRDKLYIENEIAVMLKGKVLEQKIMSVIPFIIIVFLRITSGDFMASLYHNVTGICVMSLCLLIYALSVFFSMKIVDITV